MSSSKQLPRRVSITQSLGGGLMSTISKPSDMVLPVAGVTLFMAASPYVLPAIGFTKRGIAAGSIASWIQSISAAANGGGVASMCAGGIFAVLQSAGAQGAPGLAFVAIAGFAAGVEANKIMRQWAS